MTSEMERILGLEFTKERVIPGATVSTTGREVIYVMEDASEKFSKLFPKLMKKAQPRFASGGGAIVAGCVIGLPDGRRFHAISFKGDLLGWRKQIEFGAAAFGLLVGEIRDGEFILASGEKVALSHCKAEFY